MDGKVKVISQADGMVGVYLKNLNFSREWMAKGQVVTFPKDVLEEAMFDPGFKSMIEQGILFIDDLAAAKDLGLEDEEAEVPTRYRTYSNEELKALVTRATFDEFLTAMETLPAEQVRELCDWAITLRMRSADKIAYLKEHFHFDVDKGIYLDNQAKE